MERPPLTPPRPKVAAAGSTGGELGRRRRGILFRAGFLPSSAKIAPAPRLAHVGCAEPPAGRGHFGDHGRPSAGGQAWAAFALAVATAPTEELGTPPSMTVPPNSSSRL